MPKTAIRKFDSFQQQREADIKFYRSLTPAARFEIFRKLQVLAYGPEKNWPPLKKNPRVAIRSIAS